jgi:hypothetical protein
MTVIYRILYRSLRALGGTLFNIAHSLQWMSLKMHDKSNYGAHRSYKSGRKNYLKNWAGYAYDFLTAKYRELKVRLDK